MLNHFDFSDSEFEQLFKECKLDPAYFSHEAHIRLAWINIKKYGLTDAISHIDKHLQQFVAYNGALEKYNKTLTIAAIKTVFHFTQKSKSNTFQRFIKEFPRLKYSFKELLNCHYSFDLYNSSKGKSKYLEPDLMPFD